MERRAAQSVSTVTASPARVPIVIDRISQCRLGYRSDPCTVLYYTEFRG